MSREPRYFPPAEAANADGLVGIGGELSTAWLLDAYRHAIFPWPAGGDVLAWWSPDPRAVLDFGQFHLPRRLRQVLRSERFEVTSNRDFAGVIRGCATAQARKFNTWITRDMVAAYCRLHAEGVAQSVETWRQGRLVGGVYGVAIGGLFAAESMFYRESEASKVALAWLVGHLQARGYGLIDIQMTTPHTQRFGAREIPRAEYLRRLATVVDRPVTFGEVLAPESAELWHASSG